MTPPSEELESFRWTLLGMYLCIVGGLCLLLVCMCTFIVRFLMNGDEVVRGHTLYLFVPSAFPIMGCVDKALSIRYWDYLDVRFALLTVNESCRSMFEL
jgi:hypothetical protein